MQGFFNSSLAASVSSMMKSKNPFYQSCSIRFATGSDRPSFIRNFLSCLILDFTFRQNPTVARGHFPLFDRKAHPLLDPQILWNIT